MFNKLTILPKKRQCFNIFVQVAKHTIVRQIDSPPPKKILNIFVQIAKYTNPNIGLIKVLLVVKRHVKAIQK